MEVGNPVLSIEHPDHDAKEDRDDGHVLILLSSLSDGGKIKSSEDGFSGKPGVSIHYLVDGFTSRKFFKDEFDRDSRAGHNGLTHHDRWIGLD